MEIHRPLLVLLTEPMLHSSDLPPLLQPFTGNYDSFLNSEDSHDQDLSMESAKAHGGTMIMWHTSITPYVSVLPTTSPGFVTIVLKMPSVTPSLHTVLYLPTAGKDQEFATMLVELEAHIEEILSIYPDTPHFIRGDANSNPNNHWRFNLLNHFSSSLHFSRVPLQHPTYHHFIGDGCFDSEIDILLVYGKDVSETLTRIICKLDSPLVESHHDVILSSCSLPTARASPIEEDLVTAPRISNNRTKIIWSDDGIKNYEEMVGTALSDLSTRWGNSASRTSLSVLLSSTYQCLSFAACSTNKFIDLSTKRKKKPSVPPNIRRMQSIVLKRKKTLDYLLSANSNAHDISDARTRHRQAKTLLRQYIRADLSNIRNKRDETLSTILSVNPSAAYKAIKSSKEAACSEIQNLKVGDKLYSGEKIPDGFYDSLSSLKSPDMSPIYSSPPFQETLLDYHNILKIAKEGEKIPPISPKDSTELLHSLKADVNDFYSITASHFINAGFEGLRHFHFLLNIIIMEINNSSLEELNTIWACILWKGHGKDKESERSYRTISTCPLLAKPLDSYVGAIYSSCWAAVQADTQFQGSGSNHELAALLLTESINFSLFSAKKPVFLLLLDAKSAFDLVPKESIIVNAFKAGSTDQGLIYLNNRLGNRRTFCEWSKTLMGPIMDKLGVEQGGVNSDRLYKLANNDQLNVAQSPTSASTSEPPSFLV